MVQQCPRHAQRRVADVGVQQVVVVAVHEDRFLVQVLERGFVQLPQQPDLHLVVFDDHAADGARSNLYDDITGEIIAELEEGRLPWVQPWGTAAKAPLAMPRNAATSRQY
ncbi:ArdC family protein, partial [uncultured Chitinophaga sp.]|uniref:ArdC family protein n=1 Tax=uncultured Chitinophaga sp. TaxID=339340 RepID=UPI0034594FD1